MTALSETRTVPAPIANFLALEQAGSRGISPCASAKQVFRLKDFIASNDRASAIADAVRYAREAHVTVGADAFAGVLEPIQELVESDESVVIH